MFPRPALARSLFMTVMVSLLAACGSGDSQDAEDQKMADRIAQERRGLSPCHAYSCGRGEYCFEAYDKELAVLDVRCVRAPSGCMDDGECLKSHAKKHFEKEKYCQKANILSALIAVGRRKVSCVQCRWNCVD